MSKAYPYPQIVTNEEWSVLETTDADPKARTDNLNRQMYVPMNRACGVCGVNHGRMIRRHELGHAKWSPKTKGKLLRGTRSEALDVLEEVRINYLLGRAKLHVSEPMKCMEEIKLDTVNLIYTGSIADVILYGIGSYTTEYSEASYINMKESKTYEYVMSTFRNATNNNELTEIRRAELFFAINVIERFVRQITYHKYGQTISYRKVQKAAEALSNILEAFIDKPEPEDVKQQSQPAESNEIESDEEGEANATSAELSASGLEKRMREDMIKELNYSTTDGIGKWGDMKIHTPTLTVNLQGRLKGGRQYRPSDYGYNPKYINRYCIDKKIFKQKQRVLGGTILIDASGSMNFNGADILEIMQMLPAVNIAMYNGSGSRGDLRIVAKNGMRVDDKYLDRHSGYGNVIDGPALQWLATQPERRIWVSDMHVFGVGTHSSGFNLIKECYDICTKNKIINLKDVEEVKEHALKLSVV